MRPGKGAFIDRLMCAQSDKHVIGTRGNEGKNDGSARGKHVVVLEAFLTRARLTRSEVGGTLGP